MDPLEPLKVLYLSSVVLNLVLDAIAHSKSFSVEEEAAKIFCVASFQALPGDSSKSHAPLQKEIPYQTGL